MEVILSEKIAAGIGFEITGMLMLISSALIAGIAQQYTDKWNTDIGRYCRAVIDLEMRPIMIVGAVCLYQVLVSHYGACFQSLISKCADRL